MERRSRTLKPNHSEPIEFWLDYILLPYGEYYRPSQEVAKIKKGDILRFFNGPERPIERVMKIRQDAVCDLLCRIRYGIPWSVALKKWQSYAVLEGHGKDIISKEFCWWVIYEPGPS